MSDSSGWIIFGVVTWVVVVLCVLAAALGLAAYVYFSIRKEHEQDQKQAKAMMSVRPSGQPRNSYHERQAAEREVRKSAAEAAQRASQAYRKSGKKSSLRSTYVKNDSAAAAVDLAEVQVSVKVDEPVEAV